MEAQSGGPQPVKPFFKAYGATLVAFLIFDAVWLGFLARDFYAAQLGPLLREDFSVVAAAIFYFGYAAGVVYFAILPSRCWKGAARRGALLGLLAYGTYDLTNLATIVDWPLAMSLVDIVWGIVVTGCCTTAAFVATRGKPATETAA